MAGKNIILKEGQLLFKEGDASNGMFLVRKGDFEIYLHRDGNDVLLAKVGPGAMIGEMALFDKKPRSASVKATTDADVAHITDQEFGKLMKQIPRWFVGLMGTLSGRLRQTNERLQKVESMRGRAFQGCLRVLHVLTLLFHKDGTKEGKEYVLKKAPAVDQLKTMFPDEADMTDDLILVLEKNGLIKTRKSSQGTDIVTPNRGIISNFAQYVQKYTTSHTSINCLPDEAFSILKVLVSEAEESAYDQFTLSMDDIAQKIAATGEEFGAVDWSKMFGYFKEMDDGISLVKVSNGGVGLRVQKKDVAKICKYHKIMRDLVDKNLA